MAHLSFLVAYPSVELFALQAEEVISGLEDAALGGDGSSRIDVIPGHHSHRDASTLAFPDSVWDLEGRGNIIKEEVHVVVARGSLGRIKIKARSNTHM